MLRPVSQSIPSRTGSPFPPSAIDTVNRSKPDEQFQPHSWEELKHVIQQNRLELLKRQPSEVRRYFEWSESIKTNYGSIQSFLLKKRLGWTLSSMTTTKLGPLFDTAGSTPFQDPSDYKILRNDWPYSLEPGITHLIVWLKTRLESESVKGDMTPQARYQVADFVHWKFVEQIQHLSEPHDRVLWFKNWTALQSIPGIDHVHVLVRDIPQGVLQRWLDEDKEAE